MGGAAFFTIYVCGVLLIAAALALFSGWLGDSDKFPEEPCIFGTLFWPAVVPILAALGLLWLFFSAFFRLGKLGRRLWTLVKSGRAAA